MILSYQMSNNYNQGNRILALTSGGAFLGCLLGGLTGASILGLVVFIYSRVTKED
jgi:hypothetical protein